MSRFESTRRSDRSLASSQARALALAALLLYCTVAFFVVLLQFSSPRWFNRDEWYFLSGRDMSTLDAWFAPHNEHWTTLPVVAFKAMYALVGLHSYRPYQAMVLITHATVCVLLWVIMRRVGVRPWIATCAAAILVLFGPGDQNITWAFQITFTGSIAFGLAHLIMVDHDGRIDRRDWIGLGLGAAGLMTSGIAPVMVVGVGIAALLRRGWRLALFHTAPLAALFLTWYLIEDPSSENFFGRAPVSSIIDWIRVGETSIYQNVGQFALVGLLLAAMLIVGLAVAWLPLDLKTFRVRAAMPLALLLCVPLVYALTSTNRWAFGSQLALSSRALYCGTALTVPALGVAADALARRWRLLTPAVVALLLFGIPWNIGKFEDPIENENFFRRQEQIIIGAAYSAKGEAVPDWVEPEPDPSDGAHRPWDGCAKPRQPANFLRRFRSTNASNGSSRSSSDWWQPATRSRPTSTVGRNRPSTSPRSEVTASASRRKWSCTRPPTARREHHRPSGTQPNPRVNPNAAAEGVELEVMFDGLRLLIEPPRPGTFTICT